MAARPKAAVTDLQKHRPPNTVRRACAHCQSEATRAVYQHNCNPAVVTWEIPAYNRAEDGTLVKWPCPLCTDKCNAVLLKCGGCGRTVKAP